MIDLEKLQARTMVSSYEELSVLSLDVAIELHQLRQNTHLDRQRLNAFIEKLGFQDNDIGKVDVLQRLVDPKTVDIYNRAFFQLTHRQASTIDELAKQISEYVEVFRRNIGAIDPADLDALQKFCLALHHELLAETYDRHTEGNKDSPHP